MRSDAYSLDRFTVDPSVFRPEGDVPPWLTRRDLDEIRSVFAQLPSFSVFDPGIRDRLEQAIRSSPWVRAVRRVERDLPDVAELTLEIRKPIAWVARGGRHYLVDRHGVRLPGSYVRPVTGFEHPMPVIHGDRLASPPAAGEKWEDDALREGIAMAIELYRLYASPLGDQVRIEQIDVSGVGRRREGHSEIVLVTGSGVSIEWGSSPLYEGFGELSTERKLDNLALLCQGFPRLHGTGGRVSVRWDQPNVFLEVGAGEHR